LELHAALEELLGLLSDLDLSRVVRLLSDRKRAIHVRADQIERQSDEANATYASKNEKDMNNGQTWILRKDGPKMTRRSQPRMDKRVMMKRTKPSFTSMVIALILDEQL